MAFNDYTDVGNLSGLTQSQMNLAKNLPLKKVASSSSTRWDYESSDYGSSTVLNDTYKFDGIGGATYDILSVSYFDPFLLKIYDANGKPIVANNEANDYPSFQLSDGTYKSDGIFDWVAPYSGTYYVSASYYQGSYYKFYALLLDEDVDTALNGGVNFYGNFGNDSFYGSVRDEFFYGSDGVDTLNLPLQSNSYILQKTGSNWSINSKSSGNDVLDGVERVKFSDKIIALDVDGVAGQAFRIYKAAFNRIPDKDGLKFWVTQMDDGYSLTDVAKSFIAGEEFKNLYGSNPSNAEYLKNVYTNVLNREPDQSGYDWWLGQMNSGVYSRDQVLINFSEGPENKAAIIAIVGSMIELPI